MKLADWTGRLTAPPRIVEISGHYLPNHAEIVFARFDGDRRWYPIFRSWGAS